MEAEEVFTQLKGINHAHKRDRFKQTMELPKQYSLEIIREKSDYI